jgi:hypothetical protein
MVPVARAPAALRHRLAAGSLSYLPVTAARP